MTDVHTLVPGNISVSTKLRQRVLDFLKKSPNTFFTVSVICESIGFEEDDSTKPTIRRICKELLHFNNQPIVSSRKGFSYVTDPTYLETFREDMIHRIDGLMRRFSF